MANKTCLECSSTAPPHTTATHCTNCIRHFFVSRHPAGSCSAPGCESPMLPSFCRACVRDLPWALYKDLRDALGNPEPSAGAAPLPPRVRALERAVARKHDLPDSSFAGMLACAFEQMDREKEVNS